MQEVILTFSSPFSGFANLKVAQLTDPQQVRINGADKFLSFAKLIKKSFNSWPFVRRTGYVFNADIVVKWMNDHVFVN